MEDLDPANRTLYDRPVPFSSEVKRQNAIGEYSKYATYRERGYSSGSYWLCVACRESDRTCGRLASVWSHLKTGGSSHPEEGRSTTALRLSGSTRGRLSSSPPPVMCAIPCRLRGVEDGEEEIQNYCMHTHLHIVDTAH